MKRNIYIYHTPYPGPFLFPLISLQGALGPSSQGDEAKGVKAWCELFLFLLCALLFWCSCANFSSCSCTTFLALHSSAWKCTKNFRCHHYFVEQIKNFFWMVYSVDSGIFGAEESVRGKEREGKRQRGREKGEETEGKWWKGKDRWEEIDGRDIRETERKREGNS